ncbi:hypothetical protein AB0K43_07520 [Kitasatospora sp. NPDC049258]|uniref:hypothetical protein n=1 Tax=Kitasatospora sp. NPDC049258 TaxID=3155394 RepID=UPI00341AD2EB
MLIPCQLRRRVAPDAAGYLRFHPADPDAALRHGVALRAYAHGLGLPRPSLYLDEGLTWRGRLPAYERLLGAVRAGRYGIVLIPGPWVFGLSDEVARRRRAELSAHCRVLERPGRRPGRYEPGP